MEEVECIISNLSQWSRTDVQPLEAHLLAWVDISKGYAGNIFEFVQLEGWVKIKIDVVSQLNVPRRNEWNKELQKYSFTSKCISRTLTNVLSESKNSSI